MRKEMGVKLNLKPKGIIIKDNKAEEMNTKVNTSCQMECQQVKPTIKSQPAMQPTKKPSPNKVVRTAQKKSGPLKQRARGVRKTDHVSPLAKRKLVLSDEEEMVEKRETWQ